jgi:Icc-related predicted phosphoesterase
MNLLKRSSRTRPTRLFFAADIHGSTPTFRKFVNAASFYEADVLVYGGDLMGKAVAPIVDQGHGRYVTGFQGDVREVDGPESLAAVASSIERSGFYWTVIEPDQYRDFDADQSAVDELFVTLARRRLAEWIALAEEKLMGSDTRCYLTGGNDDMPDVLAVLDEAAGDHVLPSEGRVIDLDGRHTMITVGYSTRTPWDTPREADEDDIAEMIEASASKVPDPSRAVFNFHCPPLASGLDRCVKIDTSSGVPSPVKAGGQPVYTRAGSRAVRDAIEAYQPVVGLHGHVHESPGRISYGRTRCFNPGSQYGQGVLEGVLISLRDGKLEGYQHTSG